jgi:RecA/RadA recombinase
MTVKITGAVEHYDRIRTGSYSMDHALAGGPRGILVPGFPQRTITILSGRMMSGKSTVAEWLAGKIAGSKKIAGAFLEEFDEEFVQAVLEEAGYSGEVQLVDGEKDEDYIDGIDAHLQDEDYSVGIFDSLGAIMALAEGEGKAGEANMGRRALLISKLMRRTRSRIRNRKSPVSLICTNHLHPNIGTFGNSLSGGVTQQYMASNLIELSVYHDDEHFFDDGSQIIGGYCKKVKFGPSYGKFQLFNLAGYGPHLGLGAVLDCLTEEIATKEKGKKPIKLGDKSFGTFTKLIEAAKKGDTEIFQPFQTALQKLGGSSVDVPKKRGRKTK